MVELLVTIVIAGIVFAAMVPLFTTILGKNSADNMRNISAFIAQDKIERLRQLDYMEITPENLNRVVTNTPQDFKSGQFGPTVTYHTGSGSKTFETSYTVTTFVAPNQTEQYKDVSVHVYWVGAPLPVKDVYQVTRIYRQFAGPSVSLGITPTPDLNGVIFDPVAPNYVTLTATVPEAWRGSSGTPPVPLTSRVTFSITLNDVPVDSQDVLTSGMSGQYRWTWTGAATATLGLYKFTAVAFASDESAGEEAGLYARLDSSIPDPPTGLQAFPQVNQVLLQWDPCPHSLFDHFEIWRSDTLGQAGSVIASPIDNQNTTYTDTSAAAGTKYYYSLKAVTRQGMTFFTSLACPQVSATPLWPLTDDTTPPSAPGLTVAKVASQPTINLTWTASVDNPPPTPPSGLDHYLIYRSANGSTWGTAIKVVQVVPFVTTDTSWADMTAGWSTTWYYRIEAFDLALNFSTSTVKSATTDAAPTIYTLTVRNASTTRNASVWVRNMSTLLYYTTRGAPSSTPPAFTTVNKNNKKDFKPLPPGSYQVYANFNGQAYVSTPVFSATGAGPYVCTIQ